MILDESKPAVIRNYLEKIGMEGLFEDAKNKVKTGITDENEVNRVC